MEKKCLKLVCTVEDVYLRGSRTGTLFVDTIDVGLSITVVVITRMYAVSINERYILIPGLVCMECRYATIAGRTRTSPTHT